MSVCSIDGCREKYYGKGYCRGHYRWFVEFGHTELPKTNCDECDGLITGRRRQSRFCSSLCQMVWHRKHGCYTPQEMLKRRGACSIDGCESPVHAHGMCRTHSMRLWRHGDPNTFLAKRVSGPCSVDGCEAEVDSAGLCEKHYIKNYISKNRQHWNAYHGARRARVRKATPRWADTRAIRNVYLRCAKITAATGVEHHVDHIVPINGKSVCGLHVHWNLQVIPGADNLAKSNKM